MAANSERWLYIGRSSVALAVLTADLALAVLSSRFRTAPTVSLKQGQYAPYVLVSLFVFYIGDFVALVLESRSRSEIPNFSASFSGVALAIVVAIRLEGFTAQDKTPALYTKVTSWFLLGIVEIYTAVRLGSSHFSPSPYHEIRSFLAAARAVAYISVVILLSLVYGKRYQSLSDSELDGRCSVPEPNQAGESGDAANNDDAINGIAGTDVLGIRMEAKDEVKMLGGWWPFLKKFKIFLKYTWPFGKRSLQIRFVLSVIIVMVQRAIEVVVPFRHADLLNAVTVLADPWGPLRNLVVLQVMDNLILAWTRKLLWIDVELYRIEKLRVESHSHIVRQDAHFHSSIHAADSIKAVDRAQSIHTLLDDLIFAFTPNMVTLVVALGALITRYGPFMGIILMSTVAFYSVLEKRSVKVLTRERDKYITVRENQERRRQDSVHGWATVANYNRVEHEIGQFASAVIAWIQQWRKYYMLASLFGFSQSFVVQNGYLAGYAFVIFEIYSKKATVGDLIAFPGLWRLLQEPTDYFTTLASDKLEEILDATRLRRILERVPDTGDGDEVMDFVSGRVEFQNVSFSYPGSSSQEIDNISFEIKGGSKVAFVGSTGAGKSTILRLLSRSRFCTGGNILIDGQNVNTLKTES